MPPRQTENLDDKIRMPQQHVREGRGEAGYLGDVEVYETKKPASLAGNVTSDSTATSTTSTSSSKAYPDGDPSTGWTRAELDAYAAANGKDTSGAGNKEEALAIITG